MNRAIVMAACALVSLGDAAAAHAQAGSGIEIVERDAEGHPTKVRIAGQIVTVCTNHPGATQASTGTSVPVPRADGATAPPSQGAQLARSK